MKKVIVNRGKGHTEFKSEKPVQTVPVIMDNIIDPETGAITHYICEGNRIFSKEIYDQNFKLDHGIKMRPKGYKGKNPDTRRVIF